VAHAFAQALDVSPWDGLLLAVRIAAGRVAFCEAKLGSAYSDRQLEPPGEDSGRAGKVGEDGDNLNFWVKQAEFWHDRLARISKLAIDAGVAERLVRQLEVEAQAMILAANAGLDAAGVTGSAREAALRAMSAKLLELEQAAGRDTLDGELA
jgi:hypothetical protein